MGSGPGSSNPGTTEAAPAANEPDALRGSMTNPASTPIGTPGTPVGETGAPIDETAGQAREQSLPPSAAQSSGLPTDGRTESNAVPDQDAPLITGTSPGATPAGAPAGSSGPSTTPSRPSSAPEPSRRTEDGSRTGSDGPRPTAEGFSLRSETATDSTAAAQADSPSSSSATSDSTDSARAPIPTAAGTPTPQATSPETAVDPASDRIAAQRQAPAATSGARHTVPNASDGSDSIAQSDSGNRSDSNTRQDSGTRQDADTQPESSPVTASASDLDTDARSGDPTGPVPPNGTQPSGPPPVDPYIQSVESATAAVTAQIDAHGTPFSSLSQRNFPKQANPGQILKSLAAAIDGGHQALVDRFVGITPDPASRQQPPHFGKTGPSKVQLAQLVTAANQALPSGAQLTLPSGDAMAMRVALHAQVSALNPADKAVVAEAMVDSALAATTKRGQKLVNQLRVMLELTGLQHIAEQANANIVAAGLDQPGRWEAHASEVGDATRPSSRYERLVTGGPMGIAYTVESPNGQHVSDFDGIRQQYGGGFELLDSKGDYRRYVPGTGTQRLQGEASRQILAADGRPIVWVSQFGDPQLAALRGIIQWALASTGLSPTPPFTVTHETGRRPPPPTGGSTPSGPPPSGPAPSSPPPSTPTPSGPPPAGPAASGPTPGTPPAGETPGTPPSGPDPNVPNDPGPDEQRSTDLVPPSAGHPVSPIRSTLVMNIPGTAFHGDAAVRTNTSAVSAAIAESMDETLRDSTRGRIADAAGFQEIISVEENVYDTTTLNGNDARITVAVGTTPTTHSGERPIVLIERTSEHPAGSTSRPSFTITVSDTALGEHVGQALAHAFAQVSALTDGHTTRESVLSRDVDVVGQLFSNDFSVTDMGTVGAIRYLQHSIDATHGKHRLQAMHMRHLVNVLGDAGMMLTPSEVHSLMQPARATSRTIPTLNRLVALPRDIHHVVIAANIDPDAKAITTGMPSKSVYLARGMLQHGVAGFASAVTVGLAGMAGGSAELAAIRGASILVARMAGGVAQARGEFVQAVRKAWGATHNTANSIVKGGPSEQITQALVAQVLQELADETGRPLIDDHTAVTERRRPDTRKVPSIWATAGRYGSAGLTSELVNVASFSAAHAAQAAVEQLLAQTLTGTPGALVGALSTIVGEQYLLNATEKQGGGRKAADNAVEYDVAASIRDVIDTARTVHAMALEARGARITDLQQQVARGEPITAEQRADIGTVPSFADTLTDVATGIQQALAVGPEAEAALVTLVEQAENAQTRLRTVMKTPTRERLELHAKLVELGMEMPDAVYKANEGTTDADARAEAQAARAWVHKWLGLQTSGLADRLAKMSLRPSAVASLGSYELKNLLAGGVGSAATMTTFGVITGLDPAHVTLDALLGAVATTLVGGTMEHGVQTAAENRAQLAKPKSVRQSAHKLVGFRHAIDVSATLIEHLETRQQEQLDELLGTTRDAQVTDQNVREQSMQALLSIFGASGAAKDYVGGINVYGSRVLGRDSTSSLSFAGLTGDPGNIAAGLVSASSAHLGEGLIKHHGQSSDVVRKRQLDRLTAAYHNARSEQELGIQRGEHIDDIPPNATFTPPPIERTPFDSEVVPVAEDDPHRLHIAEVPTVTTVTVDDMTYTIDLENLRATIIDHSPPRSPSTPTPPSEIPPSRPHTTADRPVYPPRRITNYVRGAQWREPWWRRDPIAPFVLEEVDPPIKSGDAGEPGEPLSPQTVAPPTDAQPPLRPDPDGTASDAAGQPPTSPSQSRPQTSTTDQIPSTEPADRVEPDPAIFCELEHDHRCGLAWRPAEEAALDCAVEAARQAARLLGLRLIELDDGRLLLELPDGSFVHLMLEEFSGGAGEAVEVDRDGAVLTIRINVDASILDIAIEMISGVTAVGRYETGAALEPSVFGAMPPADGTPYSISDYQRLARIELLLGYLSDSRCTTDVEMLRLLLSRELDEMGVADGDPYADRFRALLPDEMRGSLLQELDTWPTADASQTATSARPVE